MITGELRSQVDKIWEAFWNGGIANPLSVIEQFTFLLFIRRLDERQITEEKKANLIGKELTNPIFTNDQAELRWNFMIPTPRLLDKVVQQIDQIVMDDRDTKGDLYEYMLSKIASAGQNGQFRTPRHIIKMMVDMVQPKETDTICDPSCGTAGFLATAGEYFHDNKKDLFNKPDEFAITRHRKAQFNWQRFIEQQQR